MERNIKMDLRVIGYEDQRNWVDLSQDAVEAFVNITVNFQGM
jgi:hypothetical protein